MRREKYLEINQGMTLQSHAADAFRYLAIGLENRTTYSRPPQAVTENAYNPFAI